MKKILTICGLVALPLVASSQETQAPTQTEQESVLQADFNKAPTYITSNKLTLLSGQRLLQYTGKVHVIHQQMDLTCDRMEATYNEKNEIQQIVAFDNVFIKNGPNVQARSEKAVYTQADETVTLTENPELVREGSVLSADLIRIFLEEERSVAEGEVRVKLIQKTEEEKNNAPKKQKALKAQG